MVSTTCGVKLTWKDLDYSAAKCHFCTFGFQRPRFQGTGSHTGELDEKHRCNHRMFKWSKKQTSCLFNIILHLRSYLLSKRWERRRFTSFREISTTPSFLKTNKNTNVTKESLERFQCTEEALEGIVTILGYQLKLLFSKFNNLEGTPCFFLHQQRCQGPYLIISWLPEFCTHAFLWHLKHSAISCRTTDWGSRSAAMQVWKSS